MKKFFKGLKEITLETLSCFPKWVKVIVVLSAILETINFVLGFGNLFELCVVFGGILAILSIMVFITWIWKKALTEEEFEEYKYIFRNGKPSRED